MNIFILEGFLEGMEKIANSKKHGGLTGKSLIPKGPMRKIVQQPSTSIPIRQDIDKSVNGDIII